MTRPAARIVKYKGYTITKAVLFDGADWQDMGWDATLEGTGFHQAARTLREAKIDVDTDVLAKAEPRCTCGAVEMRGCFCEGLTVSQFLASGGTRRVV